MAKPELTPVANSDTWSSATFPYHVFDGVDFSNTVSVTVEYALHANDDGPYTVLHNTRLWKAARIFTSTQAEATSFVRERVLRVLQGDVAGVVRGLKQMASLRALRGKDRRTMRVICAYLFDNGGRQGPATFDNSKPVC